MLSLNLFPLPCKHSGDNSLNNAALSNKKALVVIPTYNERENIERLIRRLLNLKINIDILVVDDNSPDGTGPLVDQIVSRFNRVHIIHREKKEGIGQAYIAGFKWALAGEYGVIMGMDADFSHRPRYIPAFLKNIEKYDMVIGSRWMKGGRISNWPLFRVILSRSANFYVARVLNVPICDMTGGFNCFKRKVLEKIDLDSIHSDGYSFQIEIKYRAIKNNFKLFEIPITFTDRKAGSSKISKRIIWEAMYIVWKFKFLIKAR